MFLFLLDDTLTSTSSEDQPDGYLQLKIFGYNREGSCGFQLEDTAYSSPTFVRMLQGKVFVIGPEGATIGSGTY